MIVPGPKGMHAQETLMISYSFIELLLCAYLITQSLTEEEKM